MNQAWIRFVWSDPKYRSAAPSTLLRIGSFRLPILGGPDAKLSFFSFVATGTPLAQRGGK